MQHAVRTAIAAVIAAVIGFGLVAPAATAATAEKPAHAGTKGGPETKGKGQEIKTAALIRNLRRQVTKIQAVADANVALVAGSVEATAANDEAAAALVAATEKIDALSSASTKAEVKAVRTDLRTARKALEAVEVALGTATVTEEPAV